jgi:hypothetical protein
MSISGLKSNISEAKKKGIESYKKEYEDYKNDIYEVAISMDYDDDILFGRRKATITDMFFSDAKVGSCWFLLPFLSLFLLAQNGQAVS